MAAGDSSAGESAGEVVSADTAAQAADADALGTEPVAPTVFVQTAVLNLRAGPGTTYALLGAVVEGDALPILGKSDAVAGDFGWWQVDTVAGPAWLFGEHVRVAGPLDSVPQVAVDPADAATSAEPASSGAASSGAASSGATEPVAPAGLTLTIDGVRVTLRPAGDNR